MQNFQGSKKCMEIKIKYNSYRKSDGGGGLECVPLLSLFALKHPWILVGPHSCPGVKFGACSIAWDRSYISMCYENIIASGEKLSQYI